MKINDRIGKQHHNPLAQKQSMYIDSSEDNIYQKPSPGGHEINNKFVFPFFFKILNLYYQAKIRQTKNNDDQVIITNKICLLSITN